MTDHPTIKQRTVPVFHVDPLLRPTIQELHEKNTPESRALATLIGEMSKTSQEVKWQSPIVLSTDVQARATNGRVTKLEFWLSGGKIVFFTLLIAAAISGFIWPNKLSEFCSGVFKLLLP